jgi:hypothetical protein
MSQLVMQDVSEILIRPGEGNHHPVFETLGESSHSLFNEIGNDIGLLKIVMGIVDDHWNFSAQIIPKFLFNLQISTL